MSMTREYAIRVLSDTISLCATVIKDLPIYRNEDADVEREALQALSILAPEPRKEPPTVEGGNVWYSDAEDVWVLTAVDYVRKHWRDGEQWLPESALPKGDV